MTVINLVSTTYVWSSPTVLYLRPRSSHSPNVLAYVSDLSSITRLSHPLPGLLALG